MLVKYEPLMSYKCYFHFTVKKNLLKKLFFDFERERERERQRQRERERKREKRKERDEKNEMERKDGRKGRKKE